MREGPPARGARGEVNGDRSGTAPFGPAIATFYDRGDGNVARRDARQYGRCRSVHRPSSVRVTHWAEDVGARLAAPVLGSARARPDFLGFVRHLSVRGALD